MVVAVRMAFRDKVELNIQNHPVLSLTFFKQRLALIDLVLVPETKKLVRATN